MNEEGLHPERFDSPALAVFRAAGVSIFDERGPAGRPTGRVPRWAGTVYLVTDHGQDERALRRMVSDEEFRVAALAVLALAAGRRPVSRLREFLDAEL